MRTNTMLRVALLVGAFVLGGLAVVARETSGSHYLTLHDSFADSWWWPGAVAGALFANASLALSQRPGRRAAWLLVACNAIAWVAYLVLTPRLTAAELGALEAPRQSLESSDGISFIEDGPSLLAGRRHGFWTMDTPHLVLKLFAGPALAYGEFVTLAPGFGAPPRLGES